MRLLRRNHKFDSGLSDRQYEKAYMISYTIPYIPKLARIPRKGGERALFLIGPERKFLMGSYKKDTM